MSVYDFSSEVEIDYEGSSTKATIKWMVEFDMREWGIKDASVIVPEQTIILLIDVEDENGDEIEREVTLSLGGCDIEVDAKYSSVLCPTSIEVYKGKTKVLFG
jgi:5S rRNA maturation endonuclease (ribonuclease M5)